MTENKYLWARSGDVNAFFGLMLDNIAGLVLLVGMLYGIYGFPVDLTALILKKKNNSIKIKKLIPYFG